MTLLPFRCVALTALLLLSGCGGLARERVIKHPDSPMLITQGKGRLQVSVWDGDQGKLIEYGWIDADDVVGWTLDKFDWDGWESERMEN